MQRVRLKKEYSRREKILASLIEKKTCKEHLCIDNNRYTHERQDRWVDERELE